MTRDADNRTTELREKLTERGVDWLDESNGFANVTTFIANGVRWTVISKSYLNPEHDWMTMNAKRITPEQVIAATLGNERDETYNAGFENGVKVCLQILEGYLDYPHSAVENISKWVDEQWKGYES